jgi:F-type H+-transporting ATPase subunit epsilon
VTEFRLAILSPDREWYAGPAVLVIAPGQTGEFGVLANHIPMVAGLKPGVATVRLPDEKSLYVALDGGVLGVDKHGVRLLTSRPVVCDSLEQARSALVGLLRDA